MMRKFVGFLLALLVFGWSSGASATPYSLAVIADNPVSYWRFEETGGTTAVDAMGANSGTYVGTPQFSQAGPPNPPYAGMVGDQSVFLDGQYIDVGNNTNIRLDATDFTIEAWVYQQDIDGHSIFFQGGSNNGVGFLQDVLFHMGSPDGSNSQSLVLQFYGDDYTTSLSAVAPDTWTHVAVTYGEASRQGIFYVNGSEIDRHTFTSGPSFNSFSGSQIGRRYLNSGLAVTDYTGGIDELAVYTHLLSPGQLQSHYLAATIPEPSTALLLGIGLSTLAATSRRRSQS